MMLLAFPQTSLRPALVGLGNVLFPVRLRGPIRWPRRFRRGRNAEQVGADAVALPVDLLRGGPQLPQDGLGDGQGDLPLPRVDLVRPGLAEGCLLPQVRAADQ